MTRPSAAHTPFLWIVAVGFFMQALDTTIVNTALSSMARDLHAAPLAMQSIVVAYTLTMALLTPASGWLACANAYSVNQLVMARVLQGIGGSMLLPIGRLAVLRTISGEAYVAALAMVSVAGQIGPLSST